MYYDTYRGKRKKKRRNSGCSGWLLRSLFKLLGFILVLALLAAGALYALPAAMLNIEPTTVELAPRNGLPASHLNVLLLGLDFLDEGQQRSDSMMVASIGYDGLRLTSLMRDTIVNIHGHGRGKLNSAYSLGGAELAMRTVNETFGLNITNYIAVDLKTLVDLVDAVGGVEIDVSDKELENLNKYAWNTYTQISRENPSRYARYANTQPLTRTGKQTLNGLFATTYSRIREIDSDYMRTARQREVLSATLDSFKRSIANPALYKKLFDMYEHSVQTNLSLPELISIGEKVLVSGNIETNRAPRDEHITDYSSHIEITDPSGNIRALHEFIYG